AKVRFEKIKNCAIVGRQSKHKLEPLGGVFSSVYSVFAPPEWIKSSLEPIRIFGGEAILRIFLIDFDYR
ncbi:MAG TPA: hypothetical protein VMT46_00625, partial [Anaerolineaceae bacterium]|nr:hypothetical protein [Anaerolineaceae bacterium]